MRRWIGMGVAVLVVIGSLWVWKAYILRERSYDVTLVGPIEMRDGIGRQVAELAAVLSKDYSVEVIAKHCKKIGVPRCVLPLIKRKGEMHGKVVIMEEPLLEESGEVTKYFSTVAHPGQIRIAYSMWEASRIPAEWVVQLNLYYDAVVVPDPYLIKVYQDSGVTLPVFCIPLGLDLEPFLHAPLKSSKNPVMVFGNLGSALDRKNQVLLVRAFAKALGNVPDAVLYINSRYGDSPVEQAIIEEVQACNCSNIHYTRLRLDPDAYLRLFQKLDCYVSLAKGEGFSIQPREAMALGIPVIATNNTAQTTICQSGLVKVVSSELLEPGFYGKYKTSVAGHRYNCEEEEVIAALQDMYLHYQNYLAHASDARNWAAQYSYERSDLGALYKVLVKPGKVVLGDRNVIENECLITNSQALYDKYCACMQ